MKSIHMVTFILLVVGGLNWLAEAFGFGLESFVPAGVAKIVYILVGASAVYEIATHKKSCKVCDKGASAPQGQM